jgi:peroxiredoxin|tara:strand:+ start:104 stop:511 length:408 start_codon:yes stop_codon:yes gene_type:complete
MNRLKLNFLGVLSFSFLTLYIPKMSADEMKHLGVGDTVPQETIQLETGERVSLLDHLGGEPAILIFYRGGWCPFCIKQLAQLNDITEELAAEGVQLIAISTDLPEKLKAKEKLSNLDYELASDSTMELSQAFGIV